MPTCQVCQRVLDPAPRGRPPRYCSRACRARAYRARQATQPVESPVAETGPALNRQRIVRTAIAVADREGLSGLSMRRVAAELGVGVMSLYHHIPSRDDLVDLMVDAVFGERPLPTPGPVGWRARLELSARQEWELYRDHSWLPPLVASTTRPPIVANLLAYAEWRMRAVDGLGLDFATMVQIQIVLSTHMQGPALALHRESEARRDSRLTRGEWMDSRAAAFAAIVDSREFSMLARYGEEAYRASEPDAIFEFGLQRMLDSIAVLLGPKILRDQK